MEKLKRLKEMLMDGVASETSRGLQSVDKETIELLIGTLAISLKSSFEI